MATPVMAPVPMTMHNTVSSAAVLKFPCSADKQGELRAMTTSGMPPALASRGMTPAEWAECCEALSGVVEAQFFKACPVTECIYYCVPGGPIQMCLCFCNPITWPLCIMPVDRAKKACKLKCTAILFKYGYKVC